MKLLQGDCIDVMSGMEAQQFNCCVTSPPYFGLRDYGHDGQIGLEKTPDEYVARLVDVFREVRRVLRDDGTLWLNLGDSYAANRGYQVPSTLMNSCATNQAQAGVAQGMKTSQLGLKPKDLIGIPWRVAFALQADGWYLRQDIIWHKPNPMPESVTDRCTKAHEYMFLLSKRARYYYDADAVREAQSDGTLARWGARATQRINAGSSAKERNDYHEPSGEQTMGCNPAGRNRRSVWTVVPKPYKGAHFATFPPDLIKPCILAGCPKGGVVLDPFVGSGTTVMVAQSLGRNGVGIELNADYIELAKNRINNAVVETLF